LDDLCIGRSFDELSEAYSNLVVEFGVLFVEIRTTLIFVQARTLRVSFLKTVGRAVEAWNTLGEVVKDIEEIGLHREDEKMMTESMKRGGNQLWHVEMRRRALMNLLIWDRQDTLCQTIHPKLTVTEKWE
jgi:hypothetical protein